MPIYIVLYGEKKCRSREKEGSTKGNRDPQSKGVFEVFEEGEGFSDKT
ncbi:hypothetical protein KKH65_00065 [bacterium]|nr:hypothetical protein [bacterium]